MDRIERSFALVTLTSFFILLGTLALWMMAS
jgi:hypothetical protein